MALLTTQSVVQTGLLLSPVAAAGGGDSVNPDDSTFLYIDNGGGGSITATVVVPGTFAGQNRPDVAVSVPNGTFRYIGPLVRDLANTTTGVVDITYSGVTSVTVAAIKV